MLKQNLVLVRRCGRIGPPSEKNSRGFFFALAFYYSEKLLRPSSWCFLPLVLLPLPSCVFCHIDRYLISPEGGGGVQTGREREKEWREREREWGERERERERETPSAIHIYSSYVRQIRRIDIDNEGNFPSSSHHVQIPHTAQSLTHARHCFFLHNVVCMRLTFLMSTI